MTFGHPILLLTLLVPALAIFAGQRWFTERRGGSFVTVTGKVGAATRVKTLSPAAVAALAVGCGVVVALVLYYPVGALIVQNIDDDPQFAPRNVAPGESHAVAAAAQLVTREVDVARREESHLLEHLLRLCQRDVLWIRPLHFAVDARIVAIRREQVHEHQREDDDDPDGDPLAGVPHRHRVDGPGTVRAPVRPRRGRHGFTAKVSMAPPSTPQFFRTLSYVPSSFRLLRASVMAVANSVSFLGST